MVLSPLVHVPEEGYADPERILIVDDEPRLRFGLRRLLEGEGRELIDCGTGAEAIALLKRGEITLLLLDVNLPDLSGLEVLEWITTHRLPTAVIMVSAADSIDYAIQALRSGAVDFVRKGPELDDIRLKVENVLHRRRLEQSHALMTARLEQSERLHRFLVESSPDLIYTLDGSGRFVFINRRVESLLGYRRDELIGRSYACIVHELDVERAQYAFTERRSDERATNNAEVRLKCKREGYQPFEQRHIVAMLSAVGIYEESRDSERRFMGTYGVARDITERKVAEETISFQALHDQLTHLPNRRLFKDRLELAITQARRDGWVVGVMFIDLDRFKLVNDTHGHAEGDELLKSTAHRLRGCIRAGDTVARQGGDEFTVLLPHLAHVEDAALIAQKILDELKLPFYVAGQEFRATASIGIAVFPRDGDSAEMLMKNADIAMYKVKGDGKNGFQFFTPAMNACYQERITLENELRQAIENQEFELYYQPKISLSAGRIVGMEALIRWRHPVHGLLNPDGFIDLAQESGLIGSITDWVLGEACGQLSRWHSMGFGDLCVSVNVSPQEFDAPSLVERVASHMNRHGISPDTLEIEITENLLLPDVSGVIEKMRLLRAHGVRISIDDFGTRYSSLNYLRRFPINVIKIDQSFVHDLAPGQPVSPIIHAVIGIARGFGLHLVVEGVETLHQMEVLAELGCDEMQGFLFGRPLPAFEAEERLLAPVCYPSPSH
ncbi:EAL domain-containing response regulator [Geomesophilobacter sediminis]|uniref:EAL domain-containing protein n=1 Tax=Geomesophilobacter sediminis TaxID=2798584 RepID=A0A8J7J514_9BACT|nr:EAL domain-containing protein [Geomesophilobacter sediminis]MBJ6723386.1 EAL domain-containing protein [Geomesophilobacter sediminis]